MNLPKWAATTPHRASIDIDLIDRSFANSCPVEKLKIMEEEKLPLHAIKEKKLTSAINKAHTLIHSLFLSFFLYQRLSLLLNRNDAVSSPPFLPCLLLFLSELLVSVVWLSERPYRWRIIDRTVFIDRLPAESNFPAVDVMICTADPDKEPTIEVMNTVISAMALDYPSDKLHVYLSDDGGADVTLNAGKEAWGFATWWVPFCRNYEVKCRCPMAYFEEEDESESTNDDFLRDKLLLKEKYEAFKRRVTMNLQHSIGDINKESRNNHPPLIQVINEQYTDSSIINPNHAYIPRLIYVAREKRSAQPHNFKAGALNVLLRVSGMLSNSPIILVLDCDMYCNDPISAKQAMCFYLDQEISPSLGFVQFPQRFRNLSKNDLYDTGHRLLFKSLWKGVDGLNMGPILSGTGFYINRKVLYHDRSKDHDVVESRNIFGSSNEFIKSLRENVKKINYGEISQQFLREVEFVASCKYEKDTKWGEAVGYLYHSVVEDCMTGYNLHCRGWKSVYLDPQRDPFLGTTTTNLNDVLTQSTRWIAGLIEVGVSRFCPLMYGPSRRGLTLPQRSCYAWLFLYPIMFLSAWCFAVIPQLCLLHGIAIYPKVSSKLFPVVAFIVFSSQMKHLQEVLTTDGTIESWWNECRMWAIKILTSHTYGSLDAILKILGLKTTSFIPTNKVIDEEQDKRYHQGIYDFQASTAFLVSLGTVVILNIVCFTGGTMRMIIDQNWDAMAAQVILSSYLLVLSSPVILGMVVRNDRGKFSTYATVISVVACFVVLALGPRILLH